jgi:FAD dependent oxidoreductase TIGR03364
MKKSAIVIGAGIVGLATARALFHQGWKVKVIEKNPRPVGASIRNFGMVWPVGQPQGTTFERAMRSRAIWLEMSEKAKFWAEETGSLHLAYSALENEVIGEYVGAMQDIKSAFHLNPEQTKTKSPAAIIKGLKGALWTEDEVIVDPRQAIWQIAAYLGSLENISFEWNKAVTEIKNNKVFAGKSSWEADVIMVCSGADFETLYPEVFQKTEITKCKLQMMRLIKQPANWRIGPPLCAGLSFIHYKGFQVAPSLPKLKEVYAAQYPDLLELGIHVMVSQNGTGQLTIGDSHEYGLHLDPFDRQEINDKILDFLKTFAVFKDWSMESSWHGIYPKMTNGATELILKVDSYVWIVNGLGGAGMTLSFGLGEEVVNSLV